MCIIILIVFALILLLLVDFGLSFSWKQKNFATSPKAAVVISHVHVYNVCFFCLVWWIKMNNDDSWVCFSWIEEVDELIVVYSARRTETTRRRGTRGDWRDWWLMDTGDRSCRFVRAVRPAQTSSFQPTRSGTPRTASASSSVSASTPLLPLSTAQRPPPPTW